MPVSLPSSNVTIHRRWSARPRRRPSRRRTTRSVTLWAHFSSFHGDFAFLLANHFDEHSLGAIAIEFAVEDLLPAAKIELALRDRDDDLAAHDLPLEVGIGIVFARAVVVIVVWVRVERSEVFEPDAKIVMQAALVVVDKHTRRDV